MSSSCIVEFRISAVGQGAYVEETGHPNLLLYAVEDPGTCPVFHQPIYFLRRSRCPLRLLRVNFGAKISAARRRATVRGLLWFLRHWWTIREEQRAECSGWYCGWQFNSKKIAEDR